MISKWSIGIFLILAGAIVSEAIECTPTTCDTVRCKPVQKKDCKPNQVFKPKGGFCGCCGLCVTQLEEGDNCAILKLRGGPPPTVECGRGLTCDPKTNKCVGACPASDSDDSSE